MFDQIHQLKLEVIDFKTQANYWKAQFDQVSKIRDELYSKIENLEGKLKKREHQLFGKKSEKRNPKTSLSSTGKKRGQQNENSQPKRRDYDHLPTTTETYMFENGCGCQVCGKPFENFGEPEESEVLEIEVKPYRRKIIRRKAKKSCQCDGGPQVMTAPGPQRVIPGSRIGISIWIELLMAKYQFGQPIHRTLKYYTSHGLDLAQGTITGGLYHFCDLFQPVVDAIHNHCLKASFWHADETRWSVFEKIAGKETTRWYLWLFESKDAAVYVIDPTRATKVIEDFFDKDTAGTLMVDRYSAYQCYAKKNLNIHLSFCWAHIRREFLDYAKESPQFEKWAFKWVERIRCLYDCFAFSRIEKTKGAYAALDKSAKSMRRAMLKERKLIEAPHGQKRLLDILDTNWKELTRFVKDAELPIDNNEAERSLRTPVVGRKNFYGSGAIWSAKLSAQCYSIFKTLSMNQVNIHQWLFEYLEACARSGGQAPKCLDSFLPWKNRPPSEKVLNKHKVA